MKIRNEFLLRKVADTYVVLPIGQATLDLNGVLMLNETGAFLWRQMEHDTTREALAEKLKEEYEVSLDTALRDIDKFVSVLQSVNCFEK